MTFSSRGLEHGTRGRCNIVYQRYSHYTFNSDLFHDTHDTLRRSDRRLEIPSALYHQVIALPINPQCTYQFPLLYRMTARNRRLFPRSLLKLTHRPSAMLLFFVLVQGGKLRASSRRSRMWWRLRRTSACSMASVSVWRCC